MENLKRSKWALWLLAFLLMIPPEIYAQSLTVKGNVKDSNGEEIIGASVLEKGNQTNGTITDLDGNFSLTLTGKSRTLIISYIGMKTKEVKITPPHDKNLQIVLEDDNQSLEEVVVIGYGSKARKDLTGSVGSVSGAKLAAVPVSSAGEALQGKIAGVQVTTVDGAPGAEINIRVRGGTSVTQSNQPLYIVDGFQADNINDIPPTDIQSIDVLKDASLTAIYGAKGGNGVVIVTTKSAQQGKMKVEFNMYAQMRTLARKLKLLNSYEFVRYQLDNVINNNSDLYKWRGNFGNPADIELYKNQRTNDWQDEIMGGHPMSYMYNVTLNGGNEKLRFNTSITHHNENGIMMGSGVRRTNINIKINTQLSSKLKLLINPRMTFRRDMGAGADNVGKGGLINILRYRPSNGLRDFTYRDPETIDEEEEKNFEYSNPKGDIDQNYQLKHSWNFTNQASLEWTPIKGLTLRSDLAQQMSFSDNNRFYGYLTSEAVKTIHQNLPLASITDGRSDKYSWTNTASYNFNMRDIHNFSFLLGQEIQHYQKKENGSTSHLFPQQIEPKRALNNMGLGQPYTTTSSISSPERTASFFGQASYNYDHKYLLSATFRADGSTKFAPGEQWGYFPSISGAWVLTRESFLENNPVISNLKLRGAIGMAGNNRIDDDMWRYQYSIQSSGGPGFHENSYNGENFYANSGGNTFPNTKIKWETTVTRNLAIDLGLFNDRLSITPEIYWNTTKDLLYQSDIPLTTGYQKQMQNIGQVTNRGFELTINGDILQHKDYALSANLTFGFNKTRIDKLNGTDEMLGANSNRWSSKEGYDYYLKVGEQIGLIYGYVYDGIYGFEGFDRTTSANFTPTLDENGNYVVVDCDGLFGTAPGRPKFKDISGPDNKPDGKIDDYDRVVIGNTNPKFQGGFSLNGNWKNFDFTCNFNYIVGFDVYNANAYMLSSSEDNKNKYYNLLSKFDAEHRWTYTNELGERILANSTLPSYLETYYIEQNKDATLWNPKDVSKKVAHSYFVEDGSFLRLQDVTIGYTLPKNLTRKLGVERLRVYFTGSNLWLLTGYSGYDPEVDIQSGLTPSMDYNRYPRNRSYLLGLNLSF